MPSKSNLNIVILTGLMLLASAFLTAQTFKRVSEAKGLPVGVKAPLFKAKDQNNRTYNLAEAIKKGPVVLLFYRGQWCPICNRHLSELQDSLQSVYRKGATVVDISPERTEDLKKTADKTKASFTLLFDKDYKIEDAFDVTYQPDNSKTDVDNNNPPARLPVPATFIINKNRKIVWRHFNPDYRVRASVHDILNHLPANK